jgi:Nucleoporin complex subunit 54
MYNAVEPSQKHLYQRPPFIEQSLWEQAERDNQEPDDCVPYPVVGFQALVDRLKSQQEHAVSVKDKAKVCTCECAAPVVRIHHIICGMRSPTAAFYCEALMSSCKNRVCRVI